MTADEPDQQTRSAGVGAEASDDVADPSPTTVVDVAEPPTEVVPADPRDGADDRAIRGIDEVLGREVRLVTLPPADGDELAGRIEQVRHLARLHHPHLLEVYDVDGLTPGAESTLVLESVPGDPLALVLREESLTETDLARLGAQLASALAHAHDHGVEHGAIGPASILVDTRHRDAWLVGLTASLTVPLPVVGPDAVAEDEPTDGQPTDDEPTDGEAGTARRRDADVRALARTLTGVATQVGSAAPADPDDDAAAGTTVPTAVAAASTDSPLLAVLRGADTDRPPSAATLSDRLLHVGRGPAAHVAVDGRPTRLVSVVTSRSGAPTAASVAAGPAVRARGGGRAALLFGASSFVVRGNGRRATRLAVLGTATAALALASGLVIWGSESNVVRQTPSAEIGAAGPTADPGLLVPTLPAAPAQGVTERSTSSGSDAGSASGSAVDVRQTVRTAAPQAVEPEIPRAADPPPVQPPPVQPQPVDPQPVDPQPVDPQPVESLPVDPQPVDPVPSTAVPTTPAPTVPTAPTTAPTVPTAPTTVPTTPTAPVTTPTGIDPTSTTTRPPGTTTTTTTPLSGLVAPQLLAFGP